MDIKVIACVLLVLVAIGDAMAQQRQRRDAYVPLNYQDQYENARQNSLRIQQQIQEQIRQQQAQAMGSWAMGSASISGSGSDNPDSHLYSNTRVNQGNGYQRPMNTGGAYDANPPVYSGGYDGLNFPVYNQNRFANFGANGGYGNYGGGYGGAPGNYGNAGAFASASAGPQGSSQYGQIWPAAPGIESRFAEENPPAGNGNGNGYRAVFSQSSSSSGIGPDGKPYSHKSSTTGVNDNGKVSVKTVHDP